jgi:hypothetical protein
MARAAIDRRGSRIAPNRSSRRPSLAGAGARREQHGMPPRRALPGFSPAASWRHAGTRRCGARGESQDPLLHEPAVHGPILPAALHPSRAVRRVVALRVDVAARIASSDACNVTLSVCATCLSNRIAHEMRNALRRVCSRRIGDARRAPSWPRRRRCRRPAESAVVILRGAQSSPRKGRSRRPARGAVVAPRGAQSSPRKGAVATLPGVSRSLRAARDRRSVKPPSSEERRGAGAARGAAVGRRSRR